MSDVIEQLSDTNGTTMAQAVESANDTTRLCAIAYSKLRSRYNRVHLIVGGVQSQT